MTVEWKQCQNLKRNAFAFSRLCSWLHRIPPFQTSLASSLRFVMLIVSNSGHRGYVYFPFSSSFSPSRLFPRIFLIRSSLFKILVLAHFRSPPPPPQMRGYLIKRRSMVIEFSFSSRVINRRVGKQKRPKLVNSSDSARLLFPRFTVPLEF